MDAVTRRIARPRLLARELARATKRLRDALAEDRAAAEAIGPLVEFLDGPLADGIRAQLAAAGDERHTAVAQLVAFGLLLAHGDGRLDEFADGFDAGHPAAELLGVLAACDLDRALDCVQQAHAAIDPLAQFHELFLAACDARLRRGRGVFYTPAPILRWMVRGIETILVSTFAGDVGKQGVRFIDPACGSGAFLAGVLDQLRSSRLGDAATSLVGFDVLPATCIVARTVLARQLAHGPSLRVECANPLLDGDALAPLVLGPRGELPVILGNPPYANFGRQNRGAWIAGLLRDYKAGLRERKLNLDDDFIKFFRWGQHWIDRAGGGILALVTSRTYLDGLTHRAMRASLCRSFDEILVLDLGGDLDVRGGAAEDDDENVFGIRRGVAIGVFIKTGGGGAARVRYHALRGSRMEKFRMLDGGDIASTPWQSLSISPPACDFVPRPQRAGEYRTWPRLDEIFTEYVSGVQSKNDALLTDFSRESLAARMKALLSEPSPAALEQRGRGIAFDEACLREYLVAPLDRRWIYYEPRLVGRARWPVMRHLLRPNVALVFMRQSTCAGEYDHFLATDCLASDRVFYSTHGAPFLAPLWRYDGEATRTSNLDAAFMFDFAQRLGANHKQLTATDIFHYAYANFFSSDYRRRWRDELRVDFPRLPPSGEAARFRRLCRLGRKLVELHAGTSRGAMPAPVPICDAGLHVAARYPRFVKHGRSGGVRVSADCVLNGVTAGVWSFRLGGYDVLPRWLRQRRGRELSAAEREQLQRLVSTIRRTIVLRRQIDRAAR
jgi:hypothetical protein